MKMPIALALSAALAFPVLAQAERTPQDEYQRGYAATPMPNQAAINAGGAGGVDTLNHDAANASQSAQASNDARNGANQAQYDADRAAYMRALAAHHHAVNRTDARYVRQQNAYADAMAVWRAQAEACKHGSRRACNAPAPNPADFY